MRNVILYRVLILINVMYAGMACQSEQSAVAPATVPLAAPAQGIPATITAPNVRLTQIVASGDCSGMGPTYLTTRFTYKNASQRNLSGMVQMAGTNELKTDYEYDAQGQLSKLIERHATPNNDGTIGSVALLTFTPTNIEQTFAKLLTNGQLRQLPRALEGDARYIYRTNADGQITEWVLQDIVRFGAVTTDRYVYTYQNGNVVKASYVNAAGSEEFTLTYEYDDKVNPFFKWSWLYTLSPVLYSSRNNVTGVRMNNGPVLRTEYTYNDRGMPVSKKDVAKGCSLTFSYEPY